MTIAPTHDGVLSDDPREPLSALSAGRDDDPTGGHPFPQLRRGSWTDLRGSWDFAYDDHDRGVGERWFDRDSLEGNILVPFPPESSASGIGESGYHSIVWYARRISRDELAEAGRANGNERILLHFGAVDYRATVWVNGDLAGTHEGGHTPFVFDVTEKLFGDEDVVVVRAEDEPLDVGKPRGKQEWLERSRDIWYDRTTGIWQTVWIEAVPSTSIAELAWVPTRDSDAVRMELSLSRVPTAGATVQVHVSHDGELLAAQETLLEPTRSPVLTIDFPRQRNGQHFDKLQWSPEHPRLLDAVVTLRDGEATDRVESYLGLRTVAVRAGRFVLNDRPYFVRSVLEQGFWSTSNLAAPDDDALRREVELIRSLGFNAVRLHQKFEDPRFLYWADRLGLLVWGEAPAAYEFTVEAISRSIAEWADVLRRDRSHPCVVTWVPLNESWGVQHVTTDPAQRAYSRAITDLTRAIDPTRPVISNDGWEHTQSDILTVHDYSPPAEQRERYGSVDAVNRLLSGYGPAGRVMIAADDVDRDRPVMVSEFGGIRFSDDLDPASWGYTTVTDASSFERQLRAAFDALHASPVLAGFCYTQLTDTMQEANGLTTADRVPKLPVEVIRSIVTGER